MTCSGKMIIVITPIYCFILLYNNICKKSREGTIYPSSALTVSPQTIQAVQSAARGGLG